MSLFNFQYICWSIDIEFIVELINFFFSPAQIVKILIGLAVYCTFGLQFYVCLDIGWCSIKDRFQKTPILANYIMRTVLVIGAGKLSDF